MTSARCLFFALMDLLPPSSASTINALKLSSACRNTGRGNGGFGNAVLFNTPSYAVLPAFSTSGSDTPWKPSFALIFLIRFLIVAIVLTSFLYLDSLVQPLRQKSRDI